MTIPKQKPQDPGAGNQTNPTLPEEKVQTDKMPVKTGKHVKQDQAKEESIETTGSTLPPEKDKKPDKQLPGVDKPKKIL